MPSGINIFVYFELALFIAQVIAESGRKRHFYDVIYPGTKWCGPGAVADHYEDLGPEVQTDACCRDHDHCPDIIESGQSKHNLTNYSFYTKLNCECDDVFLKCLKSVDEKEERTARGVGHLYFDMLDTKCFKEEYPVIRCKKYDVGGSKRCSEYEYDRTSPKRYQWFDVPRYESYK
nr:PREDICTED: phospholipase A2-like isoform X2 [Bemisia tabaci]